MTFYLFLKVCAFQICFLAPDMEHPFINYVDCMEHGQDVARAIQERPNQTVEAYSCLKSEEA